MLNLGIDGKKAVKIEKKRARHRLMTHPLIINEQDYNVLLRYFSFGLHRLQSYSVWFEQEKTQKTYHHL